MSLSLISVDAKKCTKCGLCIDVCRGVIEMGTDGPKVQNSECISCGQCVAVCPNEALDNLNNSLAGQKLIDNNFAISPDAAEQFIRSCRSIRNYKDKKVEREKILKVLDIAKFAPTASNTQGVSFLVIDDEKVLKEISEVLITWMEDALKPGGVMANYPRYNSAVAMCESYRKKSEDTALRSAPCLIATLGDKTKNLPYRDNAYIGITYARLYAETIGLGSCWAGLFEFCALSGYQPLLELLNLPENKYVTTGLMLGYPKISFKRMVAREPIDVVWQ